MTTMQRFLSRQGPQRLARRAVRITVLVLLLGTTGGCGGDDSGITCSLANPARLAQSSWPKFRRDAANTGHLSGLDLTGKTGERSAKWVFPPLDSSPRGPFAASPALSEASAPAEQRVYIGSADGTMYALNAATGENVQEFDFSILPAPITSSALVGIRDDRDAVFVAGGDGRLHGLDDTGQIQAQVWPFTLDAFASAPPAIGSNGIVHVGSLGGIFFSACPNGVGRVAVALSPVLAAAAVGPEGFIYLATDRGDVHALRDDGLFQWTFPAAGTILAAPVLEIEDDETRAIYVADGSGRVSKVDASGQPVPGFEFTNQEGTPASCPRPPLARIASSPALTASRLYFGADDGNLYAIDKDTGRMQWCFSTGAAIESSPAVASNEVGDDVVVVGSNDGTVYFIGADGSLQGSFVVPSTAATAPAVRSSPALGSDGVVYVGADDGRVYAIE
jgi:outer membrane protein assembly factor BamB